MAKGLTEAICLIEWLTMWAGTEADIGVILHQAYVNKVTLLRTEAADLARVHQSVDMRASGAELAERDTLSFDMSEVPKFMALRSSCGCT
ncbi:hypothetical protein [Falsirhodobacter sp. 20TX0035]|uniref:hypothetical protein n=1 Tax=Falsirhodobacter sp. 20TX0035 TaxID=3022019 RepID=UPI00233101D3|nr:hypothetical protein [Falsirhodobacter sp. 20TX0035]MDB6452043.1 hypothetical protein [Falsirhodobacter sp. 20TX0035]